MSEQGPDANESQKSDVEFQSPPSRAQLASLMASAEESSPHSQMIRFSLAEGTKYLLTITYLSADSEPTWILSTTDDDEPTVFWSIATENPEQIYNLLLRRARNPSTRPAVVKQVDTDNDLKKKQSHSSNSIPSAEPTGH